MHFIVATAGHVDHGKSALVRALTGTDPDRLPEEKARGITIDLGFAHLALPGLDLGIVDVPGHEDFVKNMVSGVGSVDVALFVVAADDGWMPQTEEHLEILTYLGVTRAVVALTKIDLAEDEPMAIAAVRARLRDSPFADAPIIPTSIVTNRGIDELKNALAQVLATAPPPEDVGKPRLPVDRVFILRGVGTVVTGTLTGGALRRGQEVVVHPSGRWGHIRAVQNHGRDAESSPPGTRTALNLPELNAKGGEAIARGEVVTLPGLGGPSNALDVLLRRSARADGAVHSKLPRLRDGITVLVHHGSGHWTARLTLMGRGSHVPPGTQAIARLRFTEPVYAFMDDRLIIRDGSGRTTLAGAVVLDPDAGCRRAFRHRAHWRFLIARTAAIFTDACETLLALVERDHVCAREGIMCKSPLSSASIDKAVSVLVAARRMVASENFVIDSEWWKSVNQRAAARIDAAHAAHPERIGLGLGELRPVLGREQTNAEIFDALILELTTGRGGFVRAGGAIRRSAHRPALPEHLQAAGDQLRAALAARPFEPPSRKELASDKVARQALRFLLDTGEALEFGEEVIMLEENFRRMKTIITRTLRSAGPSTASDLRQVLGTTRRVLIPVLEYLDREGITRREGDRRGLL